MSTVNHRTSRRANAKNTRTTSQRTAVAAEPSSEVRATVAQATATPVVAAEPSFEQSEGYRMHMVTRAAHERAGLCIGLGLGGVDQDEPTLAQIVGAAMTGATKGPSYGDDIVIDSLNDLHDHLWMLAAAATTSSPGEFTGEEVRTALFRVQGKLSAIRGMYTLVRDELTREILRRGAEVPRG